MIALITVPGAKPNTATIRLATPLAHGNPLDRPSRMRQRVKGVERDLYDINPCWSDGDLPKLRR